MGRANSVQVAGLGGEFMRPQIPRRATKPVPDGLFPPLQNGPDKYRMRALSGDTLA